MFLRQDDYIIALEAMGKERQYTLDDMYTLKDCGIHLILKPASWQDIEVERDVYDWKGMDTQVANARKVGLRYLLLVPCLAPVFFPPEYYAYAVEREEAGTTLSYTWVPDHPSKMDMSHLSMWHPMATWIQECFIRLLCSRYHADDVQFMHAYSFGEYFLPDGRRAFMERVAVDDFRSHYKHRPHLYEEQKKMNLHTADTETREITEWLHGRCIERFTTEYTIMAKYNPSPELWLPWHGMYMQYPSAWDSGIDIPLMLPIVKDIFHPPATFMINYTHFIHFQFWNGQLPYKKILDQHNVHLFGGAEYCEGLEWTAPLAAEEGNRLLVGVKYDLNPGDTIEPKQQAQLRKAMDIMRTSEKSQWTEVWDVS